MTRIFTLAALLMLPFLSHADLDGELRDTFGAMVNSTSPHAYEGARRGAVTGGSLQARFPISSPTLVKFSPPRAQGGCGGIDLFGGSFSFISREEFNQFIRQIGANAVGYFFQLALQSTCPTCYNILENLRAISQEMSKFQVNSCRAARAAVNSLPFIDAPSDASRHSEESQGAIVTAIGGAADAMEEWLQRGDVSPYQAANDVDPAALWKEGAVGNFTWRVLNEAGGSLSGIGPWFTHGDHDFKLAVMSMVGSFVIGPNNVSEEDDEGNSTTRLEAGYTPLPAILTFTDLVEGVEDLEAYSCPEATRDEILSDPSKMCVGDADSPGVIPTAPISVKGMQEYVSEMLLGDADGTGTGTSVGIIAKYAYNQPATEEERRFIESLPPTLSAALRNISLANPGAARAYGRDIIGPFSAKLVRHLVSEIAAALKIAQTQVHIPGGSAEIGRLIEKMETNAREGYQLYAAQMQTVAQAAELYQQFQHLAPTQYVPPPTPSGGAGSE